MNQKCQRCQTENLANAQFCQSCGALLAATCTQNRTVVMPSSSTIKPSLPFDAKTIIQKFQQGGATQPTLMATQAQNINRMGQREHTVIVMDRSESMAEPYAGGISKLQAAIRAAVVLVCNKAQIDATDEIGLVAFNSLAEVIMDLHPMASHKRQMIQKIQALQPVNGTDINEGIKKARDMFEWNRIDVIRRVVLLTDGEGGKPLDTAQDLKNQQVVIDVIGIGDSPSNVNEKLLKQVASVVEGERRYRFIKDQQTLIAHYTQLANKTSTQI